MLTLASLEVFVFPPVLASLSPNPRSVPGILRLEGHRSSSDDDLPELPPVFPPLPTLKMLILGSALAAGPLGGCFFVCT